MALHLVRGGPEEHPEAALPIRATLRGIDSLLDVRWCPYAVWDAAQKSYEGRYAIICHWPQSDGRWEMVRSGEIGEAFDILGWFTTDLHDPDTAPVATDAMEARVLEMLGKCDNTRTTWKSRMADAILKTRANRAAQRAPVVERGLEVAETLHHLAGTQKTATVERVIRELSEETE